MGLPPFGSRAPTAVKAEFRAFYSTKARRPVPLTGRNPSQAVTAYRLVLELPAP
ncbi:MAG TPA: hypothetical protein VGX68_25980 [Thermoanaerobaculia bacterium]|jgi:hypothetical protein|nr:hypothetical protein [Thermoanaerobaculia bacterium]